MGRSSMSFVVTALLGLGVLSVLLGMTPERFVLTKVLSAEAAATCGGTFDDAKATLVFKQVEGRTRMKIVVRDAKPDFGYTVWVKLFGTSPLTGAPFTPVCNPSDLADLATTTPDTELLTDELGDGDDGTGSTEAVNGFYTDGNGDGVFEIDLDFPMLRGAYQFQEATSFPPEALGDDPFIIAIASHCTDERFHGLVPGTFELWWRLEKSAFEKR